MSRTTPQGTRRALPLLGASIAVCAWYVLAYRDCTRAFFNWDDFGLLALARETRIDSIGDLWTFFAPRPTGFLLYRPFSEIYFWLFRHAFGYDASPYHAFHLAVHVANGTLVYLIAAKVLRSRWAGLGSALVYAAAPGHVLAVYWIAALTMTATAFWYFAGVYAWLALPPGRRGRWAFVVFAVALLHSEHAATLPVALTLAALLLDERVPFRHAARELIPVYVFVAAYAVAKVWYLWIGVELDGSDPMARAFLMGHYRVSLAPLEKIPLLGFYVAASFSLLYDTARQSPRFALLGVAWLAVTAGAALHAGRSGTARVVLFGTLFFGLALAPALVLADHRRAFYVGIAALGSSLALISGARAVPRLGKALALALTAVAVTGQLYAGAPRAHDAAELRIFRDFEGKAARWIATVEDAARARPGTRVVLVPRTRVTQRIFRRAKAHELFYEAAYQVRVVEKVPPALPPATIAVVSPRPWAPGRDLPGWRSQWSWLR